MFLFLSYIYTFFSFNFTLEGLSIGGFHTCLAFPQPYWKSNKYVSGEVVNKNLVLSTELIV